MSGIYLHIPFCRQACVYCDFHFSTSLKLRTEMIDAMCRELELRKEYLGGEEISTIYFGGGTPGILAAEELALLMEQMHRYFIIKSDAEITLEANPDDLYKDKLQSLASLGINRLSIGIQSFFDEDLRFMNRAHDAHQAKQVIADAYQSGFKNISVDLIYGFPGLNEEKWKKNIETVKEYNIPHVSCYTLTVEKKTKLNHDVQQGKVMMPADTTVQEQFLTLRRNLLPEYNHYEISNFALPGFESKHNSSYWDGEKYLGIGPSAHSFNGVSRQWNISNNPLYIKGVNENQLQVELEQLSSLDRINEYIMTGIRTAKGIDLDKLRVLCSEVQFNMVENVIRRFLDEKLLEINANRVVLSEDAILISDYIASELFMV
jgi:oxygen-independent coproporphyrinogen III oxidase